MSEVGKRLISNPEIENATIPMEDLVYFISRLAVLVKRVFVSFLRNFFQTYFGYTRPSRHGVNFLTTCPSVDMHTATAQGV